MLAAALAASMLLTGCTARDGDDIRCGKHMIRLLGIDAPELGACRPAGRRCVKGDGQAAKAHLQRLVAGRTVRVERVTTDRYGRTIGNASVGGINLSCAQIAAGNARYKPKWDQGRRIAACRKRVPRG